MGSSLALVQLPAPAVMVACGAYHTCAIMTTGRIGCWGSNNYGQLGIGNTINVGTVGGQMGSALVLVSLPTGLTALMISCGQSFTCALLSDRNVVYCWGVNSNGELGIASSAVSANNPPTQRVLLPSTFGPVAAVSCGISHTCVLLVNGSVACWGLNTGAPLGTGAVASLGKTEAEMAALQLVQLPTGQVATLEDNTSVSFSLVVALAAGVSVYMAKLVMVAIERVLVLPYHRWGMDYSRAYFPLVQRPLQYSVHKLLAVLS